MKNTTDIDLTYENRREQFPDFFDSFPYIALRTELDRYKDVGVPWHWHNAVELFYLESGELEYFTPGGTLVFPAGTGGLVNSGVLHRTMPLSAEEENIQLLHIFEPSFLSGERDGLITQKYILPMTSRAGLQILPIFPESAEQVNLLSALRESFELDEEEWGYELRLRSTLSQLWLGLLELAETSKIKSEQAGNDSRLQMMLAYIYEHYPEKLAVADLAQAAYSSERECYRLFQENLHCTPVEYLTSYRLQTACDLLTKGEQSLTEISQLCGFGSSSNFGKLFSRRYHCTPSEYRRRWQD